MSFNDVITFSYLNEMHELFYRSPGRHVGVDCRQQCLKSIKKTNLSK